ncbi:MAG: transglutaminase domain-containing protein [Oscillospiraceae bacterium]|nr:transglutaminase domain-containing protein [Oscillospiraceae bacterium]
MKPKLISLLLSVLVLCTILSSCKIAESIPPSSASSSISREDEAQSQNSDESSIDAPTSSEKEDENPNNTSSKNHTFQNGTSSKKNNSSNKTSDSSSKQDGSQINSKVSSTSSLGKVNTSSLSAQRPAQNITTLPLKPVQPSEYYGWQQLKNTGTKAEREAYLAFAEAFGNYEKTVSFDFNVTKQEVEKAFNIYKDDYPQHFWVGKASYTERNGYVTTFVLTDIMLDGDMEKIRRLEEQMIDKADAILAKVNGSMPAIEREQIIHDILINNIKYDTTYNAENSHNVYGALINGLAVCEGYANAFQYLMRRAGIQCILVKGKYNGGEHEWNMARLEGEYYHIDVTSDDPIMNGGKTQFLKYNYFNLTEAEIKKDHTIAGNAYNLPEATSLKYNFFRYYGLTANSVDVDFVAKAAAFSANNGYEYAYMQFNGVNLSDVVDYIAYNYNAILEKANQGITSNKKLVSNGYVDYSKDDDKGVLNLKLNYE